jgi:hypothetical protein
MHGLISAGGMNDSTSSDAYATNASQPPPHKPRRLPTADRNAAPSAKRA